MLETTWKRFIFKRTANIAELWRTNSVRWDVAREG